MEQILKVLNNNLKLHTCAQVGLDTTLSGFFSETYNYTFFIDSNSEWSNKVLPQTDFTDKLLYSDQSEVFEYLEYFKPEFDMAYIYGRGDLDFQRSVINYFIKSKTKIILTHPDTFDFESNEYTKMRFLDGPLEYKLHYRDIIRAVIDEYFEYGQIIP